MSSGEWQFLFAEVQLLLQPGDAIRGRLVVVVDWGEFEVLGGLCGQVVCEANLQGQDHERDASGLVERQHVRIVAGLRLCRQGCWDRE